MSSPILPGAVLGVLGGGQLGRMFAIAARRLGYRVHVLSPEDDTPAGQVADLEVRAAYEDVEAVAEFARRTAVVTFEFENVPRAAAEAAARFAPVRPAGSVLHTTQNRLREKAFLAGAGLPVAPFRPVRSLDELVAGLAELGLPAVLKTASWGYDGKGQAVIRALAEAPAAWAALATEEAVLEAFVPFERELSMLGVRGVDGQIALYGPFGNVHRRHILDVTTWPAGLPAGVEAAAREITRTVLERLEVVGVLCVELFLAPGGELLVNELAPRPHNSGHLTIDVHVSCQFEQQVRAVCALPLGSSRALGAAAMVNLLGDLWADGEPAWASALADPDVKLHLYGKATPRPGRKMGHLTALAATPEEAEAKALAARARLVGVGS